MPEPIAVESTSCELCGRERPLTFHHLIPKAMHGKKRFLRRHTKQEMKSRGLMICRLCHDGIHALFEERELAEQYATKDALLQHPGLVRHVVWVRKQK